MFANGSRAQIENGLYGLVGCRPLHLNKNRIFKRNWPSGLFSLPLDRILANAWFQLTQKSKVRNILNSVWYSSLCDTALPVASNIFGSILNMSSQFFEPKYLAAIEMIANKFNGKSISMVNIACWRNSFNCFPSIDDPAKLCSWVRTSFWTFLKCLCVSSKQVNSMSSSKPNFWQYLLINLHVSRCNAAKLVSGFSVTSLKWKSVLIFIDRRRNEMPQPISRVYWSALNRYLSQSDKCQLTDFIEMYWQWRLDVKRIKPKFTVIGSVVFAYVLVNVHGQQQLSMIFVNIFFFGFIFFVESSRIVLDNIFLLLAG